MTESFFGTLKTELLHRRSWPTRRMAKDAVASYIEGFYNPYRLHSSLDYNSPMVFERIHDLKTAHARQSTCPLFLGKVTSEESAVALLFGLIASGQIQLRRIDGYQRLSEVLEHTEVAA